MVTGSSNLTRKASCRRDAWKPQVMGLEGRRKTVVSCSEVLQGIKVARQRRRKKVLPKTPRRGAEYHSMQSLLEVSTAGGIRTEGCMEHAWNVHDAMLLPRGNHLDYAVSLPPASTCPCRWHLPTWPHDPEDVWVSTNRIDQLSHLLHRLSTLN